MSFSSEDFHVIAEPFLVPLATSGRFSAAGTFSAAIAASRSAAAAFLGVHRLNGDGQFGLHTTQLSGGGDGGSTSLDAGYSTVCGDLGHGLIKRTR